MMLKTRSLVCLFACLFLTLLPLRGLAQIFAYHAATSAQHQSYFDTYSQQGYRMISLCEYGDPSDPRFAAVWIKRSGAAWVAAHNISASTYQSDFNTWTSQGYRPILITATGSGSAARFACVFDKSTVSGWFAKHNLVSGSSSDTSTLQYWMNYATANGYIPVSITTYGTAASPQYAGIWVANPTNIAWGYFYGGSAADYQNQFNAITDMNDRPGIANISTDQTYTVVYRDDSVGPYYAVHNLTSSQYQSDFDTYTGQGYYPIWVQAGGIGSAARYAAVFAKQDWPVDRAWSITGPSPTLMSTMFRDKFDTAMKNFMQYHGIRAGQLSLMENGKLIFSRAYTWAEPGYQITQTYSPMRLASCSKAFTAACIQKLYNADPMLKNKKVFSLLGITSKALSWQTVDSRINNITVQECVDHTGGWDSDAASYDPVFDCRNIEQQLGLTGMATNWDIARYMYGMPLQHDPGTEYHYSNLGYLLLGLVVEKLSGLKFEDYLQQNILQQDGISNVWLAHIDKTQRLTNEGYYDDPEIGLTILDPSANTLLPGVWGGGGFSTEAMVSGGGLAATATSLAQFIHKHAVWGLGGRAPNSARSGGMPGTASLAVSRTDLADYAWILNSRHWQPGWGDAAYDDLANSINAILDTLPPHVASVSVSPGTPAGGQSAVGTVTLDWDAPTGGASVTLNSSNTAVASVPSSVTVSAGHNTATFTVTTHPQAASTSETIKATYNGTSKSKTITVTPPTLNKLTLSSSSAYGGSSVTGTVTVNGTAAVNTTINLNSANSAAHVPATVTLPAGSSTVSFTITTDPVTPSTSGAISATLGSVTKSVTLTVKPPALSSLRLTPNPVVGGNAVTGTVSMTGPVAVDTVVQITNGNPAAILPDGNSTSDAVTITAGNKTVSFTIRTRTVSANTSGAVKATYNGVTKSVTLTVTP